MGEEEDVEDAGQQRERRRDAVAVLVHGVSDDLHGARPDRRVGVVAVPGGFDAVVVVVDDRPRDAGGLAGADLVDAVQRRLVRALPAGAGVALAVLGLHVVVAGAGIEDVRTAQALECVAAAGTYELVGG